MNKCAASSKVLFFRISPILQFAYPGLHQSHLSEEANHYGPKKDEGHPLGQACADLHPPQVAGDQQGSKQRIDKQDEDDPSHRFNSREGPIVGHELPALRNLSSKEPHFPPGRHDADL